jgi:hypothetical protein
MDAGRARFLVSRRGKEALASLARSLAALPVNQLAARLRREFPAEEAAALGEQIMLRDRAGDRIDTNHSWLLTSDGLEMTTHRLVAARRAERLARIGWPVIDLTCGLGGDLAACAAASLACAGLDRDAATALLAASNVPDAGVVVGETTRPPFRLEEGAVVVDPSRRSGRGRRFDPAAFSPSWGASLELARAGVAGVLKAPPGIAHAHLPPEAEVEFVQLGRSMREATVWLGAGVEPGVRRAVLLPTGATLDSSAADDCGPCSRPGAFVFDPESCVTRAGLVRHLGSQLGARLIDPQVAYLTADAPGMSPLCATFEVLDVLPFSVAGLKTRLRERRWRPDEIRRRGFPVEPDELRRLIGRVEGAAVTLLCGTFESRRTVVVGRLLRENA